MYFSNKKTICIFSITLAFLAVFSTFLTPFAYADSGVPSAISYQGRLTDSGGNPLGGTGTPYYFHFSFWDSPTVGSGSKVWPSSSPSSVPLTVKQGVFSVNIGDTDNGYPDTLDYNWNTNKKVYLQVEVSSDNGTFETLSPRSLVTSSPFAQVASQVSGTAQSSFGTTTPITNSLLSAISTGINQTVMTIKGFVGQVANLFNIFDSSGNSLFTVTSGGKVGVGTATPGNSLTVVGTSSASTAFVVGSGSAGLTTGGSTDIKIVDGAGNISFRGVRTNTGWADQVSTGFFQIGNSNDNVALTAQGGTQMNRLQLSAITTQIGGGYYNVIPAPLAADVFEVVDSANGGNAVRMVVQKSGNVGIGTTSPSVKLEVAGTIGVNTGSAVNLKILPADDSLTGINHAAIKTIGDLLQIFTVGSGNPILFGINGAEKMRLDSTGNVGIGTASPGAKLDILDTALAGSGSLAGSVLNLAQTWNTTGNPTALKLIVTNTASGGSGLLMSLANVSNGRTFTVDYAGNVLTGGNVQGASLVAANTGSFTFVGRTSLTSPADGQLYLSNSAGTDFSRLQFGGTTSAFPAIKSINTSTGSQNALQVIAADGTSNANLLITGKVGIGTTTPGKLLDVNTGSTDGGMGVTSGNTSNDPSIFMARNNGSSDKFEFRVRGSSGSSFLNISDQTNGAYDLGLNLKGNNVGIGNTSPNALLNIGGNVTATSWTTTGKQLAIGAATLTDSSGSGTISPRVANSFGAPTFASTNATTLTQAATVYIDNAPSAGANTTITYPNALYIPNGNTTIQTGILTVGRQDTTGGRLNLTPYNGGAASNFGLSFTSNFLGSGNNYTIDASAGFQIPSWAAGGNSDTVINATVPITSTTTVAAGPYLSIYSGDMRINTAGVTFGDSGNFNPKISAGNLEVRTTGGTQTMNGETVGFIVRPTVYANGTSFAAGAKSAGIEVGPPSVSAGVTVPSNYGLRIGNQGYGGNITKAVGLSIDPTSGSTNNTALLLGVDTSSNSNLPTGDFAIYNASANTNYFAGNIGVGTTSPAAKLDVWGNFNVGTSSTPLLFANTATGNVGVNVAAPSFPFQVGLGITSYPSQPWLKVENTGDVTAARNIISYSGYGAFQNVKVGDSGYGNSSVHGLVYGVLNLQNTVGESFSFTSAPNTTASSTFLFNAKPSGTSPNLFQIQNNGTANLTLNNSGFLGVNKTTPAFRLDVGGAALTDKINTDIGLNFSQVAAPDISAMTVTLVSGAGNVNTGLHYYSVTYYTATGETQASARLSITTNTSSNGQVTVANIPTSSDYRVVGRKIYRTNADQPYYGTATLIATIADNTTTTYTDNIADGTGFAIAFQDNTTNKFITINGTTKGMTLGANSTYLGQGAGQSITTGGTNTLIGIQAGIGLTTGSDNVFVGQAGGAMTTGSGNVGIGQYALNTATTNTTGRTVAIGYSAGFRLKSVDNVVIGYNAGVGTGADTTGTDLTLIGRESGAALTSGAKNIFLGNYAGNNMTTGANNIIIGFNQQPFASTTSNSLSIGNLIFGTGVNQTGSTLSTGNVGIGTTTPANKLDVWGNLNVGTSSTPALFVNTANGGIRFGGFGAGTVTTDSSGNIIVTSDERLKNIQSAFTRGLADVVKINPINYKWNTISGYDTQSTYSGFSAQNIQSAIPEAVTTNSQGYLSLQDRPILASVVNAIKEIGSVFTKIENGVAYLKEVVIEKLTAKEIHTEKLCVDDVCVDKTQLKTILLNAGATQTTVVTAPVNDSTSTPEATSTPINDSTPTATTSDTVILPTVDTPSTIPSSDIATPTDTTSITTPTPTTDTTSSPEPSTP